MPTSIPYEPSLILGGVVNQEKINVLLEMAAVQGTVDAAQEKLNLHIQEKRNLDMIKLELVDMNIDPGGINAALEKISQEITKSAQALATTQIEASSKIIALKQKMHTVKDHNEYLESPIDYSKTDIIQWPLAAESLKMDAQYFSFVENKQSAYDNTLEAIGTLVKNATDVLGTNRSQEMNKNVQTQIKVHREKHNVSGVLILTASCTHKHVTLLSPFVLDPDKAISTWNRLFNNDKIKVQDHATMAQEIAKETGKESEMSSGLHLISGATYGSSFVGMAYTLKENSTSLSDKEAERISNKLGLVAGVQEKSGLEVDSSVIDEITSALTTQKVASHVSCVVMGAIPSLQSKSAEEVAQEVIKFDAGAIQKELATLSNISEGTQKTTATSTVEAAIKRKMMQFQGVKVQNVMDNLFGADEKRNRKFDLNSLMGAFDNYIDCIVHDKGQLGVPLSYHIRPMSKRQIVKFWLDKYYPESGDVGNSDKKSDKKDEKQQPKQTEKQQSQ